MRPDFLRTRIAVVLHDLTMVWVSWTLAYLIRYSIWPLAPKVPLLSPELALVVVLQGVVFWYTGLYRGLWRFASLPDLGNIIRASLIGVLSITLALFLFNRLEGVPRSVFLAYPFILTATLGLPRLLYRLWKDHGLDFYERTDRIRVLIVGAGSAGEAVARDMHRRGRYLGVGFVDDDKELWGTRIRRLPVLGSIDELPTMVADLEVQRVVIAIPSASDEEMLRIVQLCEAANVEFRTLPRLQELMEGKSSIHQLKPVAIDDLLGRTPVTLNWESIHAGLAGKSVMVTGAGGSIGAELCRQIARLGPKNIVLLERSEFNLFQINNELERHFPEVKVLAVPGDVSDPVTVSHLLAENTPDVIFHAAAYKHVPLLESHLREAVINNVLATQTLALAAAEQGVETFVFISTDKAVNPASWMGATKRAAEILCQNLNAHSETRFLTVRFGNVLNSAGSVVPLFQQQISDGGPVTVTHPDVQRYFMTITEACQLIMQSAVLGKGGEIFVLDMGKPVKIRFLAEQLIRLAGKTPGDDITITYTGLRPGEKLFEELFHGEEPYGRTAHEKIYLARHRPVDWTKLLLQMDKLRVSAQAFDEATLARLIIQLVPEFSAAPKADDAGVITWQADKKEVS